MSKQEDWGFGPHEQHSLPAKQEKQSICDKQGEPKKKWEGQIDNDEFFGSLKQEQGEPVATHQAIYNKVCLSLAEAGCKLSEQQKMALASLVQNTTPQQRTTEPERQWVGLTDEDLKELGFSSRPRWWPALEAKLKEKNT